MAQKSKSIKFCFLAVLCLALLYGAPVRGQNSSRLYFSPASGAYAVGKNFSVGVYVGTEEAMNAVSAVISFPPDKMEVVSVSKSGSIINLWVQEPSFSNSLGTVSFEGIVLNPGFTGQSGRLLTINFKVQRAGGAALLFSSGAVLANDGFGTNILGQLSSASFTFGPQAPEITTPVETAGVPPAPVVSSPSHPDPNKWYANNDVTFNWPLTDDITGVNVLADRNPTSDPGRVSDGLLRTYTYKDVEDGAWYFHLRLRNAAGWGAISHFRFQIDTQKPEYFNIKEVPRADLTEPTARLIFDAADKTSGIDYFEVQIDDSAPEVWRDDGAHTYKTPLLEPGKHTLIAKAFDKTGNFLADSAEIVVEPLIPPIFTEFPLELSRGDILIVKGTTYPNGQVTVWLQIENQEPKSVAVKADPAGNFSFVADEKVKEGVYKVWAIVTDARGAKSGPTKKLTIAVTVPWLYKLGPQAINILAVIIPLLALLLLLLYVLRHGWEKHVMLSKRLRKELHEAERVLHQAFDSLREDVRKQIKLLERVESKRELTEEEAKVVEQLKKDLDKAEKIIKKELEHIEEEVK